MIEILKAKIHRARITEANIHYEGSITISSYIMELVGLLEYEKVTVVDVDNGNRFDTYVIRGSDSTIQFCINGGAARLVYPGDAIIIMSYQMIDEKDARSFKPKIIRFNEKNHIIDSELEKH